MGSFLPGSNPRIGRVGFVFPGGIRTRSRPTIWVRFSRATWRSQGDPASPSRPRSPVVHWKPRDRPPAFRRSSESDTRREPPPSAGREARRNMTNRREFYRLGAIALGNVFGLALAIPGIKFLLDPLGKKAGGGEFRPLTRLGQLKVGEPESFAVIAARQDAWVRFPPEPVGSVWLVRQPEGSKVPVVAFTAECPHLSCPVNLAGDRKSFFLPVPQLRVQLRRVADQRRLAPGDGHPGGRALRRRRPRGPRQVRAVPAPDGGEEAPCLTISSAGSSSGPASSPPPGTSSTTPSPAGRVGSTRSASPWRRASSSSS